MEARQQPAGDQGMSIGRRRLLTSLLGFSFLATVGGVLTPVIGYLWPPSQSSGDKSERVQVGTSADLPVGQGKIVSVNNKAVIVVNTDQGGLKAFSAICTHLGCIVEWDAARQFILCPCHDGRFNALNGTVISGPIPSPLAELTLTIEDDVVYVSEA